MEFLDLKTQQKRIRKPLEKRINNILDHGSYIMGPEVFELEEKLADYCGVKHAISCSSGTDALLIPLMAWGVGPGDAVFTTPFTYVATAEVISIIGATPIFVDVYESTYNIDCDKLEIEIIPLRKLIWNIIKNKHRQHTGIPMKARDIVCADFNEVMIEHTIYV